MNELNKYSGILTKRYEYTNTFVDYSFYRFKDAQKLVNKVKDIFGYDSHIYKVKSITGKPYKYVVSIPKRFLKKR